MYLLDTHILLWWLNDNKKLPKKLRSFIIDPSNDILVSAVSVWEIVIKCAISKLKTDEIFFEKLDQESFAKIDINFKYVETVDNLPLIHQDPFDRLLIAQAKVENLKFITKDKVIAQYDIKCMVV